MSAFGPGPATQTQIVDFREIFERNCFRSGDSDMTYFHFHLEMPPFVAIPKTPALKVIPFPHSALSFVIRKYKI